MSKPIQDEMTHLAFMRDYFCKELEGLIAREERDEDWAVSIDETTKAVHLRIHYEHPSEDFANSVILPVLKEARKGLEAYHGENANCYRHNLDLRIAICKTYASGNLVLPENASPEDIKDLTKFHEIRER